MKNHCGELVGFSFRAALWFWQPVILFTRRFQRTECYNSTFFLFLPLPSMGEWSHSPRDVGNCQYLLFLSVGVLITSFGYIERAWSSLFFVGFIVVVEEIITSGPVTSAIFERTIFAVCYFSKLFSHFKVQG